MPSENTGPMTPDAFAVFGLQPRFDVDLAALESKRATLQSSDADAAYKTLVDPVTRGRLLLQHLGGRADAETDALPPGFSEKLNDPEFDREAERRRLMITAGNLFRLLGSADNAVVKRERRRQTRETLNALEKLG